MINADELVAYARSFVGQKERPANTGFQKVDFDNMMREQGFKPGFSWCAIFCKLVFNNFLDKSFMPIFSPSAVKTYNNFITIRPKSRKLIPSKGAMVVWQRHKNGVPTWQGHIGIVSEVIDKNKFKSIEGNGNKEGGSEGKEVVEIERPLDFSVKKNGLVLLGFVDLI